ncbi:MAG: DUF1800 domain-containing protein [Armatimonadota bacterium]
MQQQTLAKYVPSASDPWDRMKAAHLLNRAGFGGRPDEVDRFVRMGPDAALDELMNYERIAESVPPPDFTSLRALWENVFALYRPGVPERQRFEARAIAFRADNQKLLELREWWITRMIHTRRPLQEKMVLFWHGLLVSGRPDTRLTQNLYTQNELFRRNPLGNFKELIVAISKDPAMLEYLDNESNRKGRPNENYARELLELFTMGIGNYTEKDIKEAARAFTGWTRRGFEFFFDARQHDDGSKTFLGKTGNWDGGDIIQIIFEQPATARFLPRRLFESFAYLRPEDELIEELAGLFRQNTFEVAPVVRAILSSKAFYSPKAMRAQVKSPAQLVVGTARLLDLDTTHVTPLARAMDLMGQMLFYPPNVGGWPKGESWITTATILVRYNFSSLVLTGGMPGLARRPAARPPLPGGTAKVVDGASTAGEVVDRLVNILVSGTLDNQRKTALVKALGAASPQAPFAMNGADADAKVRSALHLLMCSPEYQLA